MTPNSDRIAIAAFASDAEDAVDAALRIEFPIAMKTVGPRAYALSRWS
jgi:uncharacterized membrane protein YoaK (UPF0700 family)